MARVNLRDYQNNNQIKSKNDVAVLYQSDDAIRYRDIHLDFNVLSPRGSDTNPGATINDVEIDSDLKAISNSIYNIFTCVPGDKILSPEFGSDLRYYIHEPANRDTAYFLGSYIISQIANYERRVTVTGVRVVPTDDDEYSITINLSIPNISNTFSISGRLSRTQGYVA